jgi:hypothetical protein
LVLIFLSLLRKIADLERSIAELTAHRYLDVKLSLPTEAHLISAIFFSEFVEKSTIDHPKSRRYSSLAYYLSYFLYQCSPKAHRFLKQLFPLPSVSRLFLKSTIRTLKKLTVASEIGTIIVRSEEPEHFS